jgi:hypothetical protein
MLEILDKAKPEILALEKEAYGEIQECPEELVAKYLSS